MKLRFAVLLVGVLAAPVGAQEAPTWSKHIKPFLAKYCVECHPKDAPDGGLSLDTYKGLMEGGDHGKALVAGKPDASRLVRMVEGKTGPRMPPKKSTQPKAEEIPLLRAWVLAGAKEDGGGKENARLPVIAPRLQLQPAVNAVAYRGDADLFAGRDRSLVLVDVASGAVKHEATGLDGKVTALCAAPQGKLVALATSQPGEGATIRLLGSDWTTAHQQPGLRGHGDVVHGLAFSPDGQRLASCGYDRLVKLWETSTGKLIRDLKDHSDAVYGVCFSPDGKLLASAGADRAVKVWDVESGIRLYTLSESTDWVYAVAWSPDGKHLAAAGVDKSIRVWEVNREGGTVVHSVFAHEGPVNALAYSTDGKTLYSLSEDKHVKAWEAGRMLERQVYVAQSDTPLSLALRPDGKQLALGRFDGALVLLDEKSGKVQSQPLPVKPKPPVLKGVSPSSGKRGVGIDVLVQAEGTAADLVVNHPGATAQRTPLGYRLTFPATTPAGVYQLKLKNEAGESTPQNFTVNLFDEIKESEPNGSPRTGHKVTLSTTLVGAINRAGEVDYFRFDAKPGQQVGVQVQVSAGVLEPVLSLLGPDGDEVAGSANGVLGHTCLAAGEYSLGVRDREFRGGGAYRLHVGEVPVVTAVFPLGVQRGGEALIQVEGVHLGVRSVKVKADVNTALGTRLPLDVPGALGSPFVVVGEFPDVVATSDSPVSLQVGSTANGRLTKSGATNTWRFQAKKGDRLLLEVEARRLGTPLDSVIEILDQQGKPLPRAVLRCVARTYSTFRDHDSFSPGIRLETWSELAVNDYLFLNSELIRIKALPKNPDDDCQFFQEGGRRQGFLGTTPGQLSLGAPMYKVTLHPPGTTFPPNGLPLVTLFWRNDDGGAAFGKDAQLTFDPPADGEYQVRVSDARGEGSSQHVYRLTLRRPRPDFNVSFTPTAPAVWQSGAIPVTVNIDRRDGFDGEVQVKLDNLPPGFSAPAANVLAGENSTAFALHADATAKAGDKPLKLTARANIDGKDVVREATGGMAKTVPSADLNATTDQSEIAVKPGGQTRLTVRIARGDKFAGRVPLEVRGLPHGVRVLDIGLNGILITPAETMRTIVIQCDPWVQPTAHPFVVLARREGKNTEHAAKSVLLRVTR